MVKSFFILGLLLTIFQWGCADVQVATDPPVTEPLSRVYYENYDEVWRAVQLALRKYPVHLNNIESGVLETDYIKGDKLFVEPVEGRAKPGSRYKITVRAIKGKVDDRSAIRIICSKVSELQPDFFIGYQPIASYGLEEESILYRIGRYLEMERMLSKISPSN